MHCDAFEEERCRSCSLIQQPHASQLAGKQARARTLLDPFGPFNWLEPVAGAESGFRNKAKMVVAGHLDAPTLGILDANSHGVDLTDCPLYPASIQASFPILSSFIQTARLVPYDVPARSGELKYLLLVVAEHSGELMLRFVLRSTEALARIRKHLPRLLAALPALRVVSVNIQPRHMAILEGDQEVLLGPHATLPMRINDITLYLRPGSFFQTNTEIAAALYRQARAWVAEIRPASLWDLYCGVGGFALHCANLEREVIGIEVSDQAIASARLSRDELGLSGVRFKVGDATAFAQSARHLPELVIVNPPRRGLGQALCERLDRSEVRHLLYSSCNAESLARDLKRLPGFRLIRARLFDMFPHTPHFELCCLLERSRSVP